MGSQIMQGKLWGQRPGDWARIQEQTGRPGYEFVLKAVGLSAASKVLDIGCGSGYFARLASDSGAAVTGLDATPGLIEEAIKRAPAVQFLVGEMEELPFREKSYDLVSGFNSFQYAANTKQALSEAKRVLKDNGQLAVMIWGNKEDCEAASYLKAVGSLLPAPPPGAGGPFALSENHLLEKLLEEVDFTITISADVECVWDYPDADTALKGLLSAGPAARAIEHSGFEKVRDTMLQALQPYVKSNGHVVYHNKNRVVIAKNK